MYLFEMTTLVVITKDEFKMSSVLMEYLSTATTNSAIVGNMAMM